MNDELMKDVDLLHLGNNGSIAFVRFIPNEHLDRKMDNDVAFLKSMLDAKKEDDFRLKREIIDDLGTIHKKYQQYYSGIMVDNAEYLLHGKNGNIAVMNGDYQIITIPTIKPTLNEPQALSKALEYVGAKKYEWADSKVTNHPKGELVIAKDHLKGSDAFKLTWKFSITSLEPFNRKIIYVDATNGDIINDIPIMWGVNTPGTAQTRYSGTQGIICDSFAGGFRLYEERDTTIGSSAVIHTWDLLNGTNLAGPMTEFSNTNINWTAASWGAFARSQAALDAHWGAEKVLDYWKIIHNRNSLNNAGKRCTGFVHYGLNVNNSYWDSLYEGAAYGDGNGALFDPVTALDIVAHELGHGITQYTADLSYTTAESGALNEGFSDIWAACVKNWAAPTMPKWRLASGIFPVGSTFDCIRNMEDPKSTLAWNALNGPNPNTYQAGPWDFTNGAATTIHHNSTILSHWFCLVCQGGAKTNDKGFAYSVTGIGFNKAERIAFLTLLYLNSSANFLATRIASTQAAADLYGATSLEVAAVTNAWNAVGVVFPTINLGFHYLSGPGGVQATCSGSGVPGVNLTPISSHSYQLNNYTGTTIIQNVSAPVGRQVYLEEQPRGSYVVTGEMTSSMTVTYYVFSSGSSLVNLGLKFGIM